MARELSAEECKLLRREVEFSGRLENNALVRIEQRILSQRLVLLSSGEQDEVQSKVA